ncbi:transglutaminase domain-containing protein [Aminicella lysinilytica]|jgi:transglutaminase/protease-like cytokinesis protein 3|uniref:Transglutaminase superfamily protein n=1 Tax=Aminicella lysinilytica TaxID=433323 RepID=A0A4R6QBB9_9FIRM|nr:transglutaminase domain-containing protein [Aminicella lysinilytica]TDP59651.1 transglutaminase superfamily protein [Aminicella lysinilytica]
MKTNMMKRITILAMATIVAAVMLLTGTTQNTYASSEYTSTAAAGQYMMQNIINHSNTIKVSVVSSNDSGSEVSKSVFNNAIASSDIGDYYKYSVYNGYNVNWSYYTSNGNTHYEFTYKMKYKTTLSQDKAFEKKLNKTVKALKLSGKSNYAKTKAIYKWITQHVKYDYNSSSATKYTAYAALNKGKAVCQGYATLFYRMCDAAGVDAKVITGSSYGEGHAWNIVKVGSKYYNVDSTWDAGDSHYSYFLKGSKGFKSHSRASAFKTSSFTSEYPTAASNY